MVAIYIFPHYQIKINLADSPLQVKLPQQLKAQVKLSQALQVEVMGKINVGIPIHQQLQLPIQDLQLNDAFK